MSGRRQMLPLRISFSSFFRKASMRDRRLEGDDDLNSEAVIETSKPGPWPWENTTNSPSGEKHAESTASTPSAKEATCWKSRVRQSRVQAVYGRGLGPGLGEFVPRRKRSSGEKARDF